MKPLGGYKPKVFLWGGMHWCTCSAAYALQYFFLHRLAGWVLWGSFFLLVGAVAPDLKNSDGSSCMAYTDCLSCTRDRGCLWGLTSIRCMSVKDVAAKDDAAVAPVFSKKLDTGALSCENSRNILPSHYAGPELAFVSIALPLHGSQQPFSFFPELEVFQMENFESKDLEACYNVTGGTVGGVVAKTVCRNLASSTLPSRIELPYVGTYAMWAWIVRAGSKGRITIPIISVFSRWPSRMIEAAAIFSPSNDTHSAAKRMYGMAVAAELQALNKKLQSKHSFLPNFLGQHRSPPKIIHQIWTGGRQELEHFQNKLARKNKKQHFLKWTATWQTMHPTWTYFLWDLTSMHFFVSSLYPCFLETYNHLSTDIKRTDFFRILVLFHMGGVYVDIDFEALKPMDEFIRGHDIYLAEHVHNYEAGEWPNAWMASVPKHPLWWAYLLEMTRRHEMRPNGYITDSTGPHAFTETIQYYQKMFPSVSIHSFAPVFFYPCLPLNKSSMLADFECIEANNCSALYPDSVAVHHYAATWMSIEGSRMKGTVSVDFMYACRAAKLKAFDKMVEFMRSAYTICTTSCALNIGNHQCNLVDDLEEFRVKPDRKYLNEVLLPMLAYSFPKRVLNVGVAVYTVISEHVVRNISPDTEYITLDLDRNAARFGSSGTHLVGEVVNVPSTFEPESVDVVILNGVFGWRRDGGDPDKEETAAVIRAVFRILKPGGVLLLGQNKRFKREALANIAPLFEPKPLHPDLPARRTFHVCGNGSDHFFDTLVKVGNSDRLAMTKLFHQKQGLVEDFDSLMQTKCSENHLVVALTGISAVSFSGLNMLRGGCWVVAILSPGTYDEINRTWKAVVSNAGARMAIFQSTSMCSDEEACTPVLGSIESNRLAELLKALPWTSINTGQAWVHQKVSSLIGSRAAAVPGTLRLISRNPPVVCGQDIGMQFLEMWAIVSEDYKNDLATLCWTFNDHIANDSIPDTMI